MTFTPPHGSDYPRDSIRTTNHQSDLEIGNQRYTVDRQFTLSKEFYLAIDRFV